MDCTNKWCSWIQAFSQITIALVVVYAGVIVNQHMESWTLSFERGSNDLHSIENNMNSIAYSMESIDNDIGNMKVQMASMNTTGKTMENQIDVLLGNLTIINKQLDYMNYSVGGMRNNFSPQGMAKSMMPF